MDDPWQGVPGGDPFPLQVSKTMSFVPFGAYLFRNPDLPPTYIQSWNLNVQREVMRDTLVSISYIGSHITHLQIANPLNLAQFVPGNGDANGNCFLNGASTPYKVAAGAACSTLANTQSRRALGFLRPQFANEIGQLAMIETGGNQHYNGVLLSFQRRFSHGVSINANHTFSHCLGDYAARTSNGFGTSVNQTYQDPNNRHKDYGNCEIDQRHSFNLTAVAETPKFGNRTLDQVGSGWRLSTLYRKYSNGSIVAASSAVGVRTVTIGTPSAATTSGSGGDRCLCDIANQRPNLLLPDAVYLDKSGRPNTQYLNPSAFGLPALGTLGNLGRATLTLPPIWQFDVAVSRVFHVRENQSVEFRTEAFNVVNGFRTGAVDTNLSSAQFGRIRNAQDPRILQFALKYLF